MVDKPIEQDPTEAFHELSLRLKRAQKPFVVATVIEVFGSSSARTGSKAIFDANGKNLLGWVGGGCAEQHVSQQSLEVLAERKSRIIEADLDDELFGLGVACGGKMNLFLEPVLPAEEITLETDYPEEAIHLGTRYGWKVNAKPNATPHEKTSLANLFMDLTHAIAAKRGTTGRSLRHSKDLPVKFIVSQKNLKPSRITLVGATRITEALAEHFKMVGLDVRIVGPLLTPYGDENGPSVRFEPGERVIVASHTSQDPNVVVKILKENVAYVAMVGSRKRALEVLKLLHFEEGAEITAPLYVPAGLDIDARNPEEVALSIVTECLSV